MGEHCQKHFIGMIKVVCCNTCNILTEYEITHWPQNCLFTVTDVLLSVLVCVCPTPPSVKCAFISVMLMPFAIRQSVSTIEWSIERSIGEGFGKEGFGKRGRGRLTWVASGQCSPNVLWATASSLIIGDLWSFTMAPAAQNTSFHPRLIIIGRPTILHKSASCPWEFAPKVSLECSCLNFSSNRIKVKSQDGKAEHRGSLKGA